MKTAPHALLEASELFVGLPKGQMGNSEVGHMNLGAGRVVLQDLPRIDEAVEDGTLAQAQADAMKERIEADDFPLFAGPLLGHPHRGAFGFHLRRDLDAAATYLGTTEAELREALRDGETLADVAKEKGKSVDGLVRAMLAAATKRLDDAVENDRMTKAQRDEIVDGLEAWTTDLVNGVRPAFPGRPGHGFRGPGFEVPSFRGPRDPGQELPGAA
jgi:hypothetical protein